MIPPHDQDAEDQDPGQRPPRRRVPPPRANPRRRTPPPSRASQPQRRLPRTPAEPEFVEVRPPPGPWRKLIGVLLVLGFVVAAALGGAYWWYRRQVDPPGPPGPEVSVVIPKGASTSGIGHVLEKAKVITNRTVFAFYVRRKKAGPFEAGRFVVRKHSDFDSVIRVLARGPVPPLITRVNIPEGLTLSELAAKLHDGVARFRPADMLAALGSGQVRSSFHAGAKGSWEGLLFPASYDVGARTELSTVLGQMAAKMEQVTRSEAIEQKAAQVAQKYGIRLTPYQALIVASMIQKEAGSAAEAPKVAAVIYNRLQRGLPLGVDATSRYEAIVTGRRIDFTSDSPFNTRRQKGLPPTPIAAPGRYAIHAALNPADGRWLYYVLTAPGKHTFAVTNADFLKAKEICKAKALGCG